MDAYKETFDTWNKLASLYQDKFMHLDLYNETYDQFCNALSKQNSTILEIGCGPGNITQYLLNRMPGLDILGIDVAPSMIELASVNNPTAHFEVMDCRFISSINKQFDGIVCGFCLPYLSEKDGLQFIADCRNLLLDNGVIYISFVEGDKSKSGFKKSSTGHRTYFHYYNLEQLIQILLNNGFSQPQIFKLNYDKGNGAMEVHTVLLARTTV